MSNCIDVAGTSDGSDSYHSDTSCTLILKYYAPVDHVDKSIVYRYLQYTATDVNDHPPDAATKHVSSFPGHHRDGQAIASALAGVNGVCTNIIDFSSQDSCQMSEYVKVVNVEVDNAGMPVIDCLDEIHMISVMNRVRLSDTHIEQRLIYIHPQVNSQLQGFHWAEEHVEQFIWHLSRYLLVPEGNLQALYYLYVIPLDICHKESANGMEVDMYSDYIKDLHCRKYLGCDYTGYVQRIIDQLCQMQDANQATQIVLREVSPQGHKETLSVDQAVLQSHHKSTAIGDSYPEDDVHTTNTTNTFSDPREISVQTNYDDQPYSPIVSSKQLTLACDVNDPHKTTGYLAHDPADFHFIGPDRFQQSIDTVDQFIAVAKIIQSTNLPNYKMARIPVSSSLNIEAWEQYLSDYPDKRVIQYLKFGFPLSLSDNNDLHNTDISNHASAIQYPEDVEEYLNKEISLGAILGPVAEIPDQNYHCSPLLTRPKNMNKRRVILNLSYPPGNSVNYFVNKNTFDNLHFTLKFPTIDDIVQEIKKCNEDPYIMKIDVSRAFRNLRVDPKDGLKFAIKWGDSYFIDGAIAFGWVHGSASFQLVADAVRFIMKKKGFDVFAYIDDFMIVSPKHKAEQAFCTLYDLLMELGLPHMPWN